MKKQKITDVYHGCIAIQDGEYEKSLNFKLLNNSLKSHYEVEGKKIDDQMKILADAVKEAKLKYCTKDENDKPVYVDEIIKGVPTGRKSLQGLLPGISEGYDKELKEIDEKANELLSEDVEFAPFEERIKQEDIPKEIPDKSLEIIMEFLEGKS